MERRKGNIYLKSGNVIEFEAEEVYLTRVYKDVTGIEFVNPSIYLDLVISEIEAVTLDEPKEEES